MRPVVISMFDFTGNMVRPWADAGYECWCVDTQHSIRRERVEGNIRFVWGDARSWTPPDDLRPAMMFGFPPCTQLAGSGARDWQQKSWPMLRDAVDLFAAFITAAKWASCPWMAENPSGRLPTYLGPHDHTFNPCDYGGYLDPPGDQYTKRTCLWTGGGFVMPEPRPVEAVHGSMMHLIPPGPERQNLRSATPMGFAEAVFAANHRMLHHDE